VAGSLGLALALCGMALTAAEADAPVKDRPSVKTIRLLAIGNSFSHNATEYLVKIAQSQKKELILKHAAIGGCPLEKHWNLYQKNEANADDPEGKPYELRAADGTRQKVGLKACLLDQKWDIVTLQQHSWSAADYKTYQPYARNLAEYVHRLAPTAAIWLQETWAYRKDNPMLKSANMSQEQMYRQLHENYLTMAKEIQAANIIPTATAFQIAREDARLKAETKPDFDPKALKHPEPPPLQGDMLCLGWSWSGDPPKLGYDGKHGTTAGKYLGALVWYEMLFGDVVGEVFAPEGLSPADAAVLREVAHKTVRDKVLPRALTEGEKHP
jgi:hypothetical protein